MPSTRRLGHFHYHDNDFFNFDWSFMIMLKCLFLHENPENPHFDVCRCGWWKKKRSTMLLATSIAYHVRPSTECAVCMLKCCSAIGLLWFSNCFARSGISILFQQTNWKASGLKFCFWSDCTYFHSYLHQTLILLS